MINLRERDLESQKAPKTPMLQWNDSSTFADLLSVQFPSSKWHLEAKASRLHPYFKVANMVQICGLKLDWTSSLQDHLRLERYENENVLRVYRNKSFLQGQVDASRNMNSTQKM